MSQSLIYWSDWASESQCGGLGHCKRHFSLSSDLLWFKQSVDYRVKVIVNCSSIQRQSGQNDVADKTEEDTGKSQRKCTGGSDLGDSGYK